MKTTIALLFVALNSTACSVVALKAFEPKPKSYADQIREAQEREAPQREAYLAAKKKADEDYERQVAEGTRLRLAKEKADEEARQKAQKAEQDRREAEAHAHKVEVFGHVCKPSMSTEVCDKEMEIARLTSDACIALSESKRSKGLAAEEWKRARRFGVVDLVALQSAKEEASVNEENAEYLIGAIEDLSGKKFNAKKACKGEATEVQ